MPGDTGGHAITGEPFRLESVLVEPSALRISGERTVVRLEPKVMALLVALSEQAGQLWTRDELLSRLWVRNTGSDETLTRAVYLLRKALNEAAGIGDVIKTLPHPADQPGFLDTRNHPQTTATLRALLNINGEHPLEPLRPAAGAEPSPLAAERHQMLVSASTARTAFHNL